MVKSYIAKNLVNALEVLNKDECEIVAGGTDMLIQNRSHTGMSIGYKTNVLYISLIKELDYIKEDSHYIYIGATTKLESILKNKITPIILKKIIHEMASPAIRHTATLIGNIANASPAGDSIVGLYALNAKVRCQCINGERIVPLHKFIRGVRIIDLKFNEMITEVIIPKNDFSSIAFKKVAPRKSDAISKMSFVGLLKIEDDLLLDLRIALGAVYITVVRNKDIESKYIGKNIKELKENIDNILKDYEPLIKPIDDQRSNKEYRKKVALNLIKDFLLNV
ncbi:FAD binding domain-containing protein [Mycoplasmatota bacterium]|nr:FAD binding domain-containing protein [Mycoplasmatota bacterium]